MIHLKKKLKVADKKHLKAPLEVYILGARGSVVTLSPLTLAA
jgi:hypothetical protein